MPSSIPAPITARPVVVVGGPTGPFGGPTGPTGPQGAISVPGPTGTQGALGPTGNTGPTGPPGIGAFTGPQGMTGPPGSGGIGPAGPTGNTGPQGSVGTLTVDYTYSSATLSGIGTTPTAYGLSYTRTPIGAGQLVLIFTGAVQNTVADTTHLQIRYGTGSPPTSGQTVALGTVLGPTLRLSGSGDGDWVGFSLTATPALTGTSYWFDVVFWSNSGSGAGVRDVRLVLFNS